MANNFSIDEARKKLANKTGIPVEEFMYSGISREEKFIRHKFYRGMDRSIIYTVLSEDDVADLEENCPIDYAP